MAEINMEDGDVEMVDASQEEIEQYLVLKCNGCLAMASLVTGLSKILLPIFQNTKVYTRLRALRSTN